MKTSIFTVLMSVLLPCITWADGPLPFQERFLFKLGYFLPQFDSNTRVDNATINRGTELNLEERLNLPKDTTTLWGNVSWRFAERHRIQVGMFQFNRHGHRSIDEEITIGDKTYPIGAELDTTFKVTVYPIGYWYSFKQESDLEIAGFFGLQWSRISLNVSGSVTTNPGEIDRTADAGADAPLPVLGVDTTYFIKDEWSVGGSLGAFVYKIGASNIHFQGYVATANIETTYWFRSYIGVGAAINAFYFTVDVTDPKWEGKLNYSYWGPQIFLSAKF